MAKVNNSHWVGSPKEKGISGDGSEELADTAALVESSSTAVNDQVPDDDKVCNTRNGVPSPLLCTGCAVCSEESGDDHD